MDNDSGLPPLNDPQWVPQRAIDAMLQERQYNANDTAAESPLEFSERLIHEWLPAVTMGMIHQALYSVDERVRLSAQKYLMDRSLGHPYTSELPGRGNDAFRELLSDVVVSGKASFVEADEN